MSDTFGAYGQPSAVDHQASSKAALLYLLTRLGLKSASEAHHLETLTMMMHRVTANYGMPDTLMIDANAYKAYKKAFSLPVQDPEKEEP